MGLYRSAIAGTLGSVLLAASLQAASAADKPPAVPKVTTGPAGSVPAATVLPPRSNKTFHIVLSLKDGNRYIGDVLSTISPDGTVVLDSAQVLGLLKPVLKPGNLAALSAALGGKKDAALTDFDKAGIKARYDEAQLQVVLSIPPDARPSQSLEIANLDREIIGEVARPEPFSGYLNLRSSIDYVERGGSTGLKQPTVLLDGAVRLFAPVLEGEAQFAPGGHGSDFSRQGTRLVFDDESNIMRWTLGDLRVQTDGFQGSRDMAGLSVMRLYDQLAPQLNVRPRGNRSFTLAQSSTVQTFVNGQPVQQVRLDPGTYNAGNFPFIEGANDVHLVITDASGAVENVNFSIFFDRQLLRPGLTEFGLFGGVASDIVDSGISYARPKPVFTGFFRYGLSEVLTAGANFQADGKVQMGGLNGLWGSPIGTLGFDIAASRDKYAGTGYAINLGFNRLYQDTGNFQSQTFSASFEMRSRNFSILNETDNAPVIDPSKLLPNNPYLFEAAASYGRSFGQYTFVQLDARYAMGRDGQEDVGSIRGSVGYALTESSNVNASLQYATGGFQHGISAFIQLTYRFNDRSNIRAGYDTQTNMRRLSYQNSAGRGTGAWSASGDLESVPGSVNFNGSADYDANRAQLGAAQTVAYDLHGTGVSDMRTTLRAGTSIAFADRSVAVGRPIFDSFALFEAHRTLGDARIVVEPSPEGELTRSDVLGPALLSDLGSHSIRTVTYDVPEAPAGYDIGSGSFRAVPPYKSGYRVVVGSDYSLMVWGRLLDRRGEPVPLLAGRAVELAPNGKTVTLFTSRDGRFAAQGLRPGRWRIEMPAEPPLTYGLNVEKGETSLVRVGDLKPEEEK
jgi:outer membrane usher protein